MTKQTTEPAERQWKTFIQWKGTDVCMDWYCDCGHGNHEDRDFCYEVQCEECGREYIVGDEVSLTPKSQNQIDGEVKSTEDKTGRL